MIETWTKFLISPVIFTALTAQWKENHISEIPGLREYYGYFFNNSTSEWSLGHPVDTIKCNY